MTLLPWLILVTLYGACVGSFLNVVAYRLPQGKSLVTPPSQCPSCGHKLAWYDNVPVLGWLWLRGKCRYCKAPISVQYPLIEALTALAFGGLFVAYYYADFRPGFAEVGLGQTWPALVVHLTLLGALIVATLIDARLFIIPLQIPWFATVVAVLVLPASVGLGWLTIYMDDPVAPLVDMRSFGAAMGGVLGLVISLALLQTGLLPRSFDELEDEVTEPMPPDEFLDHPHPRREVLKECLFVGPPLLGVILGMLVTPVGAISPSLQVLGGVVMGYLVGGGLIWGTRILGTLAFGKEAMGLGDVHLLAAIGAVIGAMDSVLVFFVAPFLGLAAALVMIGITSLLKGKVRIIPYGPYLAAAAVIVMLYRQPLWAFFGIV